MNESSLGRNHFLGFSAGIAAFALCSASYASSTPVANVPSNICATSVAANPAIGYTPCANPLSDTSSFVGARSDPGAGIGPIDEWNYCRYLDNNSVSTSLFVPFRTYPEWNAFIAHAPSFIARTPCARQTTYTVTPDSSCISPSPSSTSIALPYDRAVSPALTLTKTANFTCVGGTEAVTVVFTAGPSTDGAPPSFASSGWTAAPSYAYSSTAGQCGSANGVGSPTPPPTADLCATGTPSAVTARPNGTWNWTCTNGTAANCEAPTTCGGKNATLSLPSGSFWSGTVSNQVIYAGNMSGDSQISLSGDNNLVCNPGGGNTTVNINGNGNAFSAPGGNVLYNITGNYNSISGFGGCNAFFISGTGNSWSGGGGGTYVVVNGVTMSPPGCPGQVIGAGTYVEP